MKKLHFALLLIFFFFISKSFAQQSGEKKGWPASERNSFISECIKEAKVAMSEDSARYYCYCMLDKVETKYITIEEAAKITLADMETEAWKKDIKNCLSGFWGTAEREVFLSECSKVAQKDGMTANKSKTYCACMLQKIEVKYPNPIDAGALTPEKLNSPEWKKIIDGCINF